MYMQQQGGNNGVGGGCGGISILDRRPRGNEVKF